MKTTEKKLILLIGMFFLAACNPLVAVATQAVPSYTPLPTKSYPSVSTPVATQPNSRPTTSGAAPAEPDGGIGSVITMDNNNQLVTYHVGETFLLKLGADFQWAIQMDNEGIVNRVMNVMVINGAQGLYRAAAPGSVTFSATGDPLCRNQKPACTLPSVSFVIHIEVMK